MLRTLAVATGAVAAGGLAGPLTANAAVPRVLLLGDSMIAGAVGRQLERGIKNDLGWEAVRQGKTSSGLARPDFYDWIAEGKRARDAAAPVSAVVTMLGGNDWGGIYRRKKDRPTPDAKWIRWGDEAWATEYRHRVEAFIDGVTPQGEQLIWIGMPVMGREKLHARMKTLNALFRNIMDARPNAHFVDIWKTLAGPDGGYLEFKGEGEHRHRIRAHDGVHVATTGANMITRQVLPILSDLVG